MNPTEAYEAILHMVDEGVEKQVFDIFMSNLGRPITRAEFIFRIWGLQVSSDNLKDSAKDRAVRRAINRLRDKDFPIVSSSAGAGYTMNADEGDIDHTIAELASRIQSEQDTIDHLRRAKVKAKAIRAWSETMKATQPALFQ